jgi:hypothetical protein
VQNALGAVSEERRAGERRLSELRSKRSRALLNPAATTSQIVAIEGEVRDTEILLERLTTIQPDLEQRLAAAQKNAQMDEINRLSAEASREIDRYRSALAATYQQHADAIADLCRMGRAAEAAVKIAQNAAASIGASFSFDMPVFSGGLLPDIVSLPSQTGMIWGRRPPPSSAFNY